MAEETNFSYAHGLSADSEAGVNVMKNDNGNRTELADGTIAYSKTYYGITLSAWMSWNNKKVPSKWDTKNFKKLNDEYNKEFSNATKTSSEEIQNAGKAKVESYFKKNIWDKHKLGEITDKKVGASIYDAMINQNFTFGDSGTKNETILTTLKNAGYTVPGGKFTDLDDAIKHVNLAIADENVGGDKVLNAYANRREQSYIKTSEKDTNYTFNRGWMKRLNEHRTKNKVDSTKLTDTEAMTTDSLTAARFPTETTTTSSTDVQASSTQEGDNLFKPNIFATEQKKGPEGIPSKDQFIANKTGGAVAGANAASAATTNNASETSTNNAVTQTPFVLPSAKQALENSKNKKYVKALEKQGYTVEQYLKDPQGTLNEISKKSQLEKNLGDAPAPPIFSMGVESKVESKIETPTEEINEVEKDDPDDFPGGADYVAPQNNNTTAGTTYMTDMDGNEVVVGQQDNNSNVRKKEKLIEIPKKDIELIKIKPAEDKLATATGAEKVEENYRSSITKITAGVNDEDFIFTDKKDDNKIDLKETALANMPAGYVSNALNNGTISDTDAREKKKKAKKLADEKAFAATVTNVDPDKLSKEIAGKFESEDAVLAGNPYGINVEKVSKFQRRLLNPNLTNSLNSQRDEFSFTESNYVFNPETNKYDIPRVKGIAPQFEMRDGKLVPTEIVYDNMEDFKKATTGEKAVNKFVPLGGDTYSKKVKFNKERIQVYENEVLKQVNKENGTNYATKEELFKSGDNVIRPKNSASTSPQVNFRNRVALYTGEFANTTNLRDPKQQYDETYLQNVTDIAVADVAYKNITTLKKGDLDNALIKDVFLDLPNSERLDFGKFNDQMKIAILNIVKPGEYKAIAQGDPRYNATWKNSVVTAAKLEVLGNENLVLNKQGEIYVGLNAEQNKREKLFFQAKDDLVNSYKNIDAELRSIKEKYGSFIWDRRGAEVYLPDTIKIPVDPRDTKRIKEINEYLLTLEEDRKSLEIEGSELKASRDNLNKKVGEWQKNIEGSWKALAFDMAKPIEQQKNAFGMLSASKGFDIGLDKLTQNFFGAAGEIGLNFAEEMGRLKLLKKAVNPTSILAMGAGYNISKVADNSLYKIGDQGGGMKATSWGGNGYSYNDQYLDFLAGAATQKIVPTNKIDKLINPTDEDGDGFLAGLFNPKAYNPSLYTISKTVSELLPYTLNIASAGLKANVRSAAALRSMSRKSTTFNKVMNNLTPFAGVNISMGKMGDKIISSLHKSFKNASPAARDRLMGGLKMVDINHRMLFFDNLSDARAQGLSGDKAVFYANATTLATGISQMVMPDVQFLKNTLQGRNLVKQFVSNIKKVGTEEAMKALNSQAIRAAMKTFSKNFFKEHAEEQLDVILNDIVKSNFLADYSFEISDVRAQREILVGTTLLTGGLGGRQAISTVRNTKQLIYNEIQDKNLELMNFSRMEQKEIEKKLNEFKNKKSGNKQYNKRKIKALEKRLEEEKKIEQNVRNIAQAINAAPKYATIDQIDTIMKKNDLVKEKQELLKQKDKVGVKKQVNKLNEQIASLDVKLESLDNTEWKKSLYNMSLKKGKSMLKMFGIDVAIVEGGKKDFAKAVAAKNQEIKIKNEERKKKGLKPLPFHKYDENSVGVVIYDDIGNKPIIFINTKDKDGKNAVETDDNFGVGFHEVFHLVFRQTVLKNPKAVKGLAFLMRQELLGKNKRKYMFSDKANYVGGKFKTYEDKVNGMEWDEMFTIISEALVQGDIKFNSTFLSGVGDVIRRTLRKAGINLKIKGTKGIVNFIRDYNAELEGNKEFSRGMRKVIKNGLKIDSKEIRQAIDDAEAFEKEEKLPEWMAKSFSSASTRGGRMRQKNIYERNDVKQDIQLSENTQKIVDENDRIRQELLNTREQDEFGEFIYDEDLRNDLVLNNMALVTALSDFAAKNPKIMGLEESKKIGFDQFQSGFSKELISLSQSYDPALIPFGAYLNRLLPLRYGDVLKAEQKGAMEGVVSIENENTGEIADDSTPADFDDAPRFVAPKYNAAKEIGVQEEVEKEIAEGLDELKQLKKLINEESESGETIEQLKQSLKEKHMLDLDLDTMELSSVEGLTYKTIARLSGVDVDKLNPRSTKFLANLRKREGKAGSNEVRSGQRFIAKHAQLILSTIFNEGHTKAFKSTNMPNVLLKFGYNKGSKRIKNNFPQYKKPNLSEKDFAEYLGIFRVTKDGKKGFEFKVDRNTSAKITAVLSLLDRTITNQSLRRSLELTGDLNERLKNSLEDGLAASAQSKKARELIAKYGADMDAGIKERMPEVALVLQEIDHENTKQSAMITKVSKVFSKDGFLSNKEARALVGDMFKESGIVKQFMYQKANLESQGIKIEPFEEFAEKYMLVEFYVGLAEKMGLKTKDGDTPTGKQIFNRKAITKGRKVVAEQVKSIIDKFKKGEATMQEVLEEIMMEEQNHITAYKQGDGEYISIAGTDKFVKNPKYKESGTPRFQLFHSEEGPKADFRKYIYSYSMDQDFLDAMEKEYPGSTAIFRDGKSDNFIEIKFEPQDGKGVVTQMINLMKKVTRKGANKYSQEKKDAEAELARKALVNKIIFLVDKLENDSSFTEQDFVVQMMTLMSNPSTTLRRAGKVVGIMDGILDENGNFLLGDKVSNENIRFEHQKPASYLLMKMIDIVLDKNTKPSDYKKLFDKELVDYNVAIITKEADKTLDKTGLKNMMGLVYEAGKEFGSMVRMFNPINRGDKNVKAIRLIKDVVNGVKGLVFGLDHSIAAELMNKPMVEVEQDMKISKLTQSANSVKYNRKPRGMSAFDFDETVGISDNFVIATKDGETKRIASDEWPMVGDQLVKEGWKMDFSDFNKVTNGKPGPLMEKMKNQIKKFGPKNVFILTARAPESQAAIHAYLESEGIKIPIENITGLGNSTGEAKALWMLNKFAEGYNDMYFVDDALPNVEAVKNVLEQLDIKSKVQIAISNKSSKYDREFNEILEEQSGVEAKKRFSKAKARRRGEEKNKFKLLIPPSAEDFVGLIYSFLSPGKKGEQQFEWFKENLIKPLNRGYQALNNAKQAIANDYKALLKKMPVVSKKLYKKIPNSDYTYGDAIRVYLWDKFGFKIPGLTDTDQANLVKIISSDVELKAFADLLGILSKQQDGYLRPGDHWLTEDIKVDLQNAVSKINRKQFFAEFLENVSIIFSPENMNKIEAIYGRNYREALEDMLYRIENGTNRSFGDNRIVNRFMNWINGAIGTTMFVNVRSALLQTLSTVNFINWEDNNIIAAAKAFANQKQFWADFTMIFNSDMLKQRRSGLSMDVNANELADYVANSGSMIDKYKAAVNYILTKGFLPTQIADSFAIAAGGATFYRNRLNKYIAEGMSVPEAKKKAFNDFQAIAEETQQSSRPDMISQQQASVLGRIILAFQNTPMQYARLTKKAALDLINRRGSARANVSRIVYYGAVQNAIFYALQTALFAMMFSDDEEDEEFFDKKQERILNGSIDSLLRGMGIGGAVVSTIKNMTIAFYKEQEKTYNKDESAVIMELANLSPPIGIKFRQIRTGERAIQWNKDLIEELPYYNLKNPVWEAAAAFTQTATNIPLSRLHQKVVNVSDAFGEDLAAWQRVGLMAGWTKWNLGIENSKTSKRRKKKKVTRKFSY